MHIIESIFDVLKYADFFLFNKEIQWKEDYDFDEIEKEETDLEEEKLERE